MITKYKIKDEIWNEFKEDLIARIKEYLREVEGREEYIEENKKFVQAVIRAVLEICLEMLYVPNTSYIYIVDPQSSIIVPVNFSNILELKTK